MGAVNTIMSLKLRGKQIAPEPETCNTPENESNNNLVQKLKMWGTLISDLFKVVMACLLSVFVPQNCPPSETFDKEVRPAPCATNPLHHCSSMTTTCLTSQAVHVSHC